MMENRVEVLNRDLKLVAVLGSARDVNYTATLNGLWRASFALPFDDPKNEFCVAFQNYIRIIENGKQIGPFRIIPSALEKATVGLWTYECEHVLATLVDDILPMYHQIGNLGVYTRDVIEYVLSFQTVKRWQLGRCAFSRQFEYSWENENLLAALFSIPKQFSGDYIWVMDTETTPWTIHLDELDVAAPPECYIRYGKNLLNIRKEVDCTNLCTRLYCFGYGEGINQLGIAEVNGGKPYIDAPPELIEKYGLITRVWVDRRFEIPENLLERGRVLLDGLQKPHLTYTVGMADLSPITSNQLDRPEPGKTVRVIDDVLREDVHTIITEVHRTDIFGSPMACSVVLANQPQDIAGTISELADRQRIEQLYAQGATNIYAQSFADNADATHPAIIKFWIPSEAVRVNKVMLSWDLERFRSYETGAANDGGSTQTSSAGGATFTSTDSGGGTFTSTAVDGGSSQTSASGGGTQNTSGSSSKSTSDSAGTTTAEDYSTSLDWTATGGRHYHRFWLPMHSHGMSHTHSITIPAHSHTFTVPNHSHQITLQAHTHSVAVSAHTHSVTIPSHTHAILHGIYEGPSASAATVQIEGKTVPLPAGENEVDIAPYLSIDDSGRIRRGTHHEVRIVPNGLTRVRATLTIQLFVQSRGGGDR